MKRLESLNYEDIKGNEVFIFKDTFLRTKYINETTEKRCKSCFFFKTEYCFKFSCITRSVPVNLFIYEELSEIEQLILKNKE